MILFLIVIAILAAPFIIEWCRIPMDAQARADAPGAGEHVAARDGPRQRDVSLRARAYTRAR